MIAGTDMMEIDKKIQLLKKTALELRAAGEKVPAVEKNANRILASVKMLEINISDIILLP